MGRGAGCVLRATRVHGDQLSLSVTRLTNGRNGVVMSRDFIRVLAGVGIVFGALWLLAIIVPVPYAGALIWIGLIFAVMTLRDVTSGVSSLSIHARAVSRSAHPREYWFKVGLKGLVAAVMLGLGLSMAFGFCSICRPN